jgi:hypothetical protein
VSATGAVHGRAKVGAVRSQGELSGEFDADSVELAGTVRDNTVIRARSLEVKLASARGKLQVIFGECELAVGDEPTEHDAVEPENAKPEAAAAAPMSDDAATPPLEAPLPEAPAMVAPPAPPAELPLAQALAEAAAAPSPDEEDDEAEDAAEGDALEASEAQAEGGRQGKRRRKRRHNDVEVPNKGWSQPPSQPPPAS